MKNANLMMAHTIEWSQKFPSMGVYKSRFLANICGPFIVGIVLYITPHNDNYEPKLFLSNLTESDEDFNLGVCIEDVRRFHRYYKKNDFSDKFCDTVDLFYKETLLPLSGDVTAQTFINNLKKYYHSSDCFQKDTILNYMLCGAVWSQDTELLLNTINFVIQEVYINNYDIKNMSISEKKNIIQGWSGLKKENDLINIFQIDDLKNVLTKIEKKFKLSKLPHRKLL